MLTAADLRYDAEAHKSFAPDGREVPHVTAILAATGMSTDFGELGDLSPRVAANVAMARERGSVVHADCHAYDDNDLLWETVDPRVRPYVEAWATFRKDKRLVPLARERFLYHPLYHYAGFTDGVFRAATGRRVMADLKTGNPDDAAADLQLAGYEAAWNYANPDQLIDERWSVWLRPGRRVPYTLVNYTDRPGSEQDFGKFCACVTVFTEQQRRRKR